MSSVPEPWATAMVKAGITDPRNATRPSWQELRRRIDVHPSTLSAMAAGTRETKQEIVDRVADALGKSRREVSEWVGRARALSTEYVPPAEAGLLTQKERDAVDELIRLLVASKRRTNGEATYTPSS